MLCCENKTLDEGPGDVVDIDLIRLKRAIELLRQTGELAPVLADDQVRERMRKAAIEAGDREMLFALVHDVVPALVRTDLGHQERDQHESMADLDHLLLSLAQDSEHLAPRAIMRGFNKRVDPVAALVMSLPAEVLVDRQLPADMMTTDEGLALVRLHDVSDDALEHAEDVIDALETFIEMWTEEVPEGHSLDSVAAAAYEQQQWRDEIVPVLEWLQKNVTDDDIARVTRVPRLVKKRDT